MKSFDQLTWRGQARRLRGLAARALAHYDLEVAEMRLLGWFTNLLFRIRTTSGTPYVLRICVPNWRTPTDLQAEIAWLLALDRDTDIGAPVPMATREGTYAVEERFDGVPGTRRCLLTTWIPGVTLGKHLSEENLRKMGILFARMHDHGARWTPPPGFTTLQKSEVLARGEPRELFSGNHDEAFSPHVREVWDRTRAVVEQAYARLYEDPSGLQVIHNDLWHDNIKLNRGRLRPLDFEDTLWGYPVQDIAMALQDLMSDVTADRYEPLQEAFQSGYESLRPWPEAYDSEIDTFRAGRLIWVANWVSRHQREHLAEHLGRTARLLEPFLETGRLRKVDS